MSINGFYLLPHPPIILPEVGKGEEKKIQKTIEAFNKIGAEIAKKTPDTIILITPHGTMFSDAVSIFFEDRIIGDLSKFGVSSVKMDIPIEKTLSNEIYEIANRENISVVLSTKDFLNKFNASPDLDHGAMVPLYFVNKFYNSYNLVHITYADLSDKDLYRLGIAINEAVEEQCVNSVIIASGDLSHRLKDDGPYGYNSFGEKFDTEFLKLLENGDVEGVLGIDNKTIDNAGECGRRSVVIMLGTLDKMKFKGEILSYEGPFGVGYGVMRLNAVSENDSKSDYFNKKDSFESSVKDQNDAYVRLARESLTSYLNSGEMMKDIPDYVTDEMKENQRGVFVSLKKFGDLRGCIGTIFPVSDCVAEEIIHNAIEAGIYDPRFSEVRAEELEDIVFSVDVLTEPESCGKKELDPKKYGVIVSHKGRRGLLLPDLEGVNTVEEQLAISLQKAEIYGAVDYTIQRFEVIRHKENRE